MNVWSMVLTVGKIAAWIFLAFLSAVGIATNLTKILNTLMVEKKRLDDGYMLGLVIWLVFIFISLYYLLPIFNGLGAGLGA